MPCDILIRGGEVIDPARKLRGIRDVEVRGDRIIAVAEKVTDVEALHSIDVLKRRERGERRGEHEP